MSYVGIIGLGALAGFTIFLGLPVAVLSKITAKTKGLLNGVAVGILLFLTVEIIGKILPVGEEAFNQLVLNKGDVGNHFLLLLIMVAGISLGLIGIPVLEKTVIAPIFNKRRIQISDSAEPTVAEQENNHKILAFSIASGIGLHNFGEGLAIGQSAASGAISLALILVIGFGLHNMTEGFGIASPLTGTKPKLGLLILLGLIGGAPTFIGTILGASWSSPIAMTLFLSIAGGSLAYVTPELLAMGRKTTPKIPLLVAVTLGFFLGYFTDLIVGFAGA